MDFALLPQVSIVGRISNPLTLKHTRRNVPYVRLLIYLYHEKHAKLMPMLAFNKVAKNLIKEAQQGDLLLLHTRIDPLPNGRYINPTLIVSEYSHLEAKAIRLIYHGKKGKELRVLFPVMPDNFRRRHHKHHVHKELQKNSVQPKHKKLKRHKKPKDKKKNVEHVSASDITVLPSKHSAKVRKKGKSKNPFKGENWVKETEELTDFDFPDLH